MGARRPEGRHVPQHRATTRAAVVAAVFAALFVAAPPARAATFTVTTTDDAGPGSLRQAVLDANGSPGADTIDFTVNGTITLGSGQITVTDELTIDGPSAATVTISGNDTGRVLQVNGVPLHLDDVTIANGAADPSGGGILSMGGNVTVARTTFAGNAAAAEGGAIRSAGASSLTVTNSTFFGNEAGFAGGAISNGFGGPLTITNSTFVANAASVGGALYTTVDSTLRNTLVANSAIGSNCSGTFVDGGGNLSWPDTTCPGTNQDPLLDPAGLQENGGPTRTVALQPESPAIDAAQAVNCPGGDQRGVPRPQGDGCDIGAFEREVAPETFEGSLTFDHVCWYQSFSSDASVTVEIRASAGGPMLFGPQLVPQSNGCVNADVHEQDLVAGMHVSVTGGDTLTTKELTLVDVTVDMLDADADTVSGTGPADETLLVETYTIESEGPLAAVTAVADETGAWTADFGGLEPPFDVTPDMGGHAEHFDGDGDVTSADLTPPAPPPAFEANLSFDNVSGCGFAPNSPIDVTIEDAPDATTLFASTPTSDDEGCFDTGYEVDLVPGLHVSVDDGAALKELTLADLSIDAIGPAENTVAGAAPPNETFNVDAFVGGEWHGLDATSDGTGVWTVDFDDIGVDITAFTHVGANIGDADDDQTAVDAQLSGGDFDANLSNNGISGEGWTPGGGVTVEIFDAPDGNLLYSGTAPTDESGHFGVDPFEHGVDLVPGSHLEVTDSAIPEATRELTAVPLSYDTLDPTTDSASGTAAPGAEVCVGLAADEFECPTAVAGEDGNWSVEFDVDVTEEMLFGEHWAIVDDADGDSTEVLFYRSSVDANMTDDVVTGRFRDYSELTVGIFASPGATTPLSTDVVTADAIGFFDLGPEVHGQDLAPGMHVVVGDGSTTKEVTLEPLTIDYFSTETDSSFGTADPGTTVLAGWSCCDLGDGMLVVADGNGDWSASFAPDDIPEGSTGHASVRDADGDTTQVRFVPAEEAIPDLMADVDALVAGGELTAKQASPLRLRLRSALDFVEAGKTKAAVAKLEDFVKQVETYVKTGKLSAASGDALIASANAIITGLTG
ncbi:MAG: hypothetical protein M3271_06765 [Actinomycetota bacterium]|nr:hypothetical protein [Actinomycetota bacterium]